MDARKVVLVQKSFEQLAALGNETAEVFYSELFALDPSLRAMFPGDMLDQRRKLFAALDFIVRSLHAPHKLFKSVEGLARKHVAYGVLPQHYTYVGNALLRTLKKQLGPQFTVELCDAWTEAFKAIAKIMTDAAYVQERGAA